MNEERRLNEELKEELARLRKRVRELEQEHGRMQETLKDSEERLRLIYDNSPIGMGFVNLEGVLVDCNEALASILGTPHSKLIGFPMRTGLTNEAAAVALARAFAGKTGAFEGEYTSALSGKQAVLRALFSPLFSPVGKLKGVLFIAEDISERRNADQALRDSEQKYRVLVETTNTGFVILDAAGRVMDANNEYVRLSGHSTQADILGRSVVEWTAAYDRERNAAEVKKCVKQGFARNLEIDYVHRDGTFVPVEICATVMGAGKDLRIFSLCRDISEKKHWEATLRENESRLRTITENAPDTILLVDRQGTITFVNRPVPGLTKEQIIGSHVLQWVPAEQHAVVTSALEAVFVSKQRQEYESAGPGPGDEVRYYHVRVMPVTAAGRTDSAVYIATDITERKRAEVELAESKRSLETLMGNLPGMVYRCRNDRDWTMEYVSEGALAFTGHQPADLVGNAKVAYNDLIHPDDQATVWHDVQKAVAARKKFTLNYRIRRADGRERWAWEQGQGVFSPAGELLALEGFITDVTDSRLLEEERLKTQKLESIGMLAGGIAHDFNNLLQGVFGYVSLVKMSLDQKEKALAMLAQTEQALHQSVNLTTQLLTFSKGGTPVKKRTSLLQLIQDAAAFALSGARTTFEFRSDPGLRQVEADEGQIGQVIQNIVLNADQAMPQGGAIEINAWNVSAPAQDAPQALAPGEYVAISVRDHGVGISTPSLSRIFDPYFTTKEKGSGLGLATSYSIAKNHGGLIDVKSEVGKGSVFTLYIPAAENVEAETPVAQQVQGAGKGGRILVMDDEEIVRTVAGELVRSLGYEADVAEHGEAAIGKYRQAQDAGRPYDVVVLDLTVRGGMGGMEAFRRLREIDPGVQAVVSSGYSDDDVIAAYQEHGFCASLRKPYDLDELDRILSAVLSSSGRG